MPKCPTLLWGSPLTPAVSEASRGHHGAGLVKTEGRTRKEIVSMTQAQVTRELDIGVATIRRWLASD